MIDAWHTVPTLREIGAGTSGKGGPSMSLFDERDRAVMDELTSSIKELAKSFQPDTFHNRQVPALQRQQKVVEFIRAKRQMYVDSPNPIVTNQVVLNLLDEVGNMLIKS